MDHDRKHEAPFDEGAALAELEQFRKEIERYQALRQGADDEFERFIRSFKESRAPRPSPTRPVPSTPVAGPPRPVASRPLAPPVAPSPVATPSERASRAPLILPPPPEKPRSDEVARPEPSKQPLAPAVEIAPPPASLVPPRGSNAKPWLITGTAVAVLAVGGYAWTLRKTLEPNATVSPSTAPQTADPESRTATSDQRPAVTDQRSATSEQRSATSDQRSANSAQRSPFESELTTIRAVWVRVTADGERIVERELAAGARIPFTARKTIVIRTGDAGAVRLTIGGQDRGALGREGEVVTRSFTVPASR